MKRRKERIRGCSRDHGGGSTQENKRGNREVKSRKEVIRGCYRDHEEVGHQEKKTRRRMGQRDTQENSFY